ncbi:MAG: hypothetical protein Tsb0021_03090 [Chlamydiales bacterium]
MKLPPQLQIYYDVATHHLQQGRIGHCEFSGATYQIEIHDLEIEKSVWVFLQLNKQNEIGDAFCSCEQEDEHGVCSHIASAYLFLFLESEIPLHIRFTRSLWYYLCWIYGVKSHFSTDRFKQKGNRYVWESASGKILFQIKAESIEGEDFLTDCLSERREETEETSLKFSNLTSEEIELWRAGKPTQYLQFELSFWNDLAKWMMLQQEKGNNYYIDFDLSAEGIPNWIHIDFGSIDLGFYISRAHLPNVIPLLNTVQSPYKVHLTDVKEIASIRYDDEEEALYVIPEEESGYEGDQDVLEKGYDLGNWVFVPDDGFYAKRHHSLLGGNKLTGEEIIWAFDEYLPILQKRIEGVPIFEEPVKAQHNLSFDTSWNLHIAPYVFKEGDLQKSKSKNYGAWTYLEGEGFFRISDLPFGNEKTVIDRDDMVGFIVQNRAWLNTQPGFHTYLSSLETQLTYRVDEEGSIYFESELETPPESDRIHDFGSWVYLADEGFYQKAARFTGLPVSPGSVIEKKDVASLLRMYQEELKTIPQFYSLRCPIRKSSLSIEINKNGQIEHHVVHERYAEYEESDLQFYCEFVYAPGEGFHELPFPSGFPKEYCETRIVDPDAEEVFVLFDLPHLSRFAGYIDPKLSDPGTIVLNVTKMRNNEEKGTGWFDVVFEYQSDVGTIKACDLWSAIHHKQQILFSDGGVLDLGEDRFRWLRLISKKHIDFNTNTFTLSAIEMLRLNAYDSVAHTEDSDKDTIHSFQQVMDFSVPVEPSLKGLQSKLRPYQENGVKWLWYLYHHHLSGLLCDDMGLGKTHQAMALIAALKNMDQRDKHFLVVCPTSVIYHWQSKLHTFLPQLRVHTFYGANRSLEGFQSEYDLLLTSYGVWRREHHLLGKIPFEVAIFDEIQVAKNAKSKLHRTLQYLEARFRIGMTGTPIENHLQELKALFDITLPGYMPKEEEYKQFFVKPIEKFEDKGRQTLLNRFIKPFILRRKKEDVLTDLPEKIEEISYCPLLPEQKKLYQSLLHSARNEILKQLGDDGKAVPYLHVFALLSRLKQICNHPAVFHKEPENYKHYDSGKWELFVELLQEARDSGQKIVVFSQFLFQLDIIEEYLKEHKIGYAGIRGSTVERGAEIERFHKDPSCEVFVASLQAGGLGIDLTSASVVIHYDRWWNAAKENQATDRVHRIGQSRGVQVFKLVTRGTFEERIHAMIARKARLMDDIIGVDDQQLIKKLDRKEIIELLQDVHLTPEDQRDVIHDTE